MALFTRDELKTHLGLSGTSHDAFIDQLVTQVSLLVPSWCNRIAPDGSSAIEDSVTDATEFYDGTGAQELRLKRYPVTSVTTVHVDSDRTFGAESLVPATSYTIDKPQGVLRFLPHGESGINAISYWPSGTRNVQVVYRGGYSTLPADLKLGAMLWAGSMFAKRAAVGIVSESIGGYSVTYQGGVAGSGIPTEAKEILHRYRDFSGIAGGPSS